LAQAGAVKRVWGATLRLLLNPFVATTAYVAALLVWLWPALAFDVMLSNGLYRLMSWSVLAGALPFWLLVLDPRPHPLARLRPGQRIVMLHLAMLPIVLTGASLTLSSRNLYPVYAVCGRFLPIPAVADQQLGGAVMWVLGAFLFAVAFFIVLGRNLEQEEAALITRDGARAPRARARATALPLSPGARPRS
jgi:putative membrane protein